MTDTEKVRLAYLAKLVEAVVTDTEKVRLAHLTRKAAAWDKLKIILDNTQFNGFSTLDHIKTHVKRESRLLTEALEYDERHLARNTETE